MKFFERADKYIDILETAVIEANAVVDDPTSQGKKVVAEKLAGTVELIFKRRAHGLKVLDEVGRT